MLTIGGEARNEQARFTVHELLLCHGNPIANQRGVVGPVQVVGQAQRHPPGTVLLLEREEIPLVTDHNKLSPHQVDLREVLADGMLERYGLDVSEVIKELFGKLGYKDGDRFFNTEEEDPRLTNARAVIEQLQQELAQKVSPEMLQAQIKKIDS